MDITPSKLPEPQAAQKPPVSLTDYLSAKNPELAKKTAIIVDNLSTVLSAIKASKVDWSAQRQTAAIEKVARINEAVQTLKMSGIVDPKMVGRIAERLAKELAQATKDASSDASNDTIKQSARAAIDALRKLVQENKNLVPENRDKNRFDSAEKSLRRAEQNLGGLGVSVSV